MKFVEFTKFGVTFKPLTEDNLEQVRIWRNSDDVRLYMQYQKEISQEEQFEWFQKVNNENNFYFLVYEQNEPRGVFNIKDIDYTTKSGETGSYLIDRKFWGTDLAGKASLLLGDFVFNSIHLESFYCFVLKENIGAINFNKHVGCIIDENHKSETTIRMICDKERFLKKTSKIIKYLS